MLVFGSNVKILLLSVIAIVNLKYLIYIIITSVGGRPFVNGIHTSFLIGV